MVGRRTPVKTVYEMMLKDEGLARACIDRAIRAVDLHKLAVEGGLEKVTFNGTILDKHHAIYAFDIIMGGLRGGGKEHTRLEEYKKYWSCNYQSISEIVYGRPNPGPI